ncbi:MAG: TolC family protein [Nitrospirae bacterium]|nr:TolC family protein [Nitrospirota bacterium]
MVVGLQKIFLEIQQAYLNPQESAERISVAEITVKQAEENLDLAKGRYEVGLGNSVELTDAMVTYTNAKTAYNQALYDYKIAEASLLKGMGDK